MDSLKAAHADLLLADKLIYKPMGLAIQNLNVKDESVDYGAAEFEINHRLVKFRTGKVTPTKTGQFVTFWKRIGKGPILPYDLEDLFDLLIVSVRAKNNFGQFIFPKNVLCEKGIVSKNTVGGKRAMRIYPPWDKTDNKQAMKTQIWQSLYFFEIQGNSIVDFSSIQNLLNG